MGGIVSDSCNHLSKTIWYYCINRKVWLSAVHIPGKDNETADYMSRLKNENTEWRLSPIVFQRILEVFYYKPEIDLFASCMNYQIGQYASWHPDRNAIAIDAFSISWSELNFYAFPPFSLIGVAIAKVRKEKCSGIMIIPWWKTQFWVPMMVLKNFLMLLPSNILTLPSKRSAKHPLYWKMKLFGIHLSRKASETQTFQEKLQMLPQMR